ncbi:MAG: 3'-5' exonuclease, partial [Rhodospirillaceae bacterium]
DFESLQGFLEHVALVMEANQGGGEDKVSIMTLHGAKGLEFDLVFLPGWEDGLFPSNRALEEHGQAGLEEERRLAYVGLTRARRRAIVCSAHRRRMYSTWVDTLPSRFLMELPAEHVESDSPGTAAPGFSSGGYGGGFGGGYGFRESPAAFAHSARPARPPVLDGSARRLDSPRRASAFKAGSRVFHQKFGSGTVTAVDGDKLDIEFDKSGRKTVMESFVARLE